MRTRAIPIVIQPGDAADQAMLFSSLGDTHLCFSSEELARWTLELWRDEKVETVEAGPQSHRWTKLLAKGVDAVRSQMGLPPQAGDDKPTAVYLTVQVANPDECQGAVWTAAGRPYMFTGLAALGDVLQRLARDDDQPKVPAGPPVDPGSETLHHAGELLVDSLRGGAA